MKFQDFFHIHRDKIEQALIQDINSAKKKYPLAVGVDGLSMVQESVTEGKMLRGMLVLVGLFIHGVSIRDYHYHIAGAVELLHTGLLIHDDVMDHDLRRRNHDSIYFQYIKEARSKGAGNPEHYGTSMAMCLGDMVFFLASEIVTKRVYDSDYVQCILSYLSQEIQYVGQAQMLDASYGQIDNDPTEEEIDQIYLYKTAHYTFSLPLIIGGVFSPKVREDLLRSLGHEMGIIFQLKDDELGLYGESDIIGKEKGSDIRENKKTMFRYLLFQRANYLDKKNLKSLFGKVDTSIQDIELVLSYMKKYQIRERVNEIILERDRRARQIIASMSKDGLDADMLMEVLTFIRGREK